jgi:hypothetical protein
MCEDESLELTHEEKVNEMNVIARCFNLMHIQRSRYELQANEFMVRQALATETDDYVLKYSIERNLYICRGKPKIRNNQSFSTEIPIPATEREKIEALIELFAQSEAGLI